MLGFIRTLRHMSLGEAVDTVRRKVQVRRWRRQEEVTVRCAGRTARLRSRKSSTDAEVIWQCFVGRQYEVPKTANVPVHHDAVQAAYERLVQSGKTPLIIDCGANMGASVAWFDLRYPNSRIVAVEPAAANVALLRSNCEGRANVTILEAGVGPDDGEAFLKDDGGGHWGYQTTDVQSSRSVRLVSLGKLIEASRSDTVVPFILKIDIEGAEKHLFDHSLDAIAAFPLIIFEPHDFFMPGARTASPFFRFHADSGRDFDFHYENVFSLDMAALHGDASRLDRP